MREDVWLGQRLGCPAWTVEGADTVEDVLAQGAGFFQAKVPSEHVSRVAELESAGFHAVDVNVTLRHEGEAPAVRFAGTVRDAEPDDRGPVGDIAAHEYSVSRFHLDPAIAPDVAARIKRDWIENFFLGDRGNRLLIATSDSRVLGFLLVLDGGETAVIDLIAVAAAARRGGAGGAMVRELIVGNVGRPVVVGSQVSNVGALRFYERLGFRVIRTQYILHRHA